MKRTLFLAVCCLLVPFSSASACEAPDWTICSTRDGCAEGCNGEAGEMLVSLEIAGVTAADLGRLLSDFSGKAITFAVSDPEEQFSLDVKSTPFGALLAELARYGAVVEQAATQTVPRGDVPEANVTLKLEKVTASELARMFDVFLSGSALTLEASEPGRLVSLEVKNMPLRDLIPILASTASVHLRSV